MVIFDVLEATCGAYTTVWASEGACTPAVQGITLPGFQKQWSMSLFPVQCFQESRIPLRALT